MTAPRVFVSYSHDSDVHKTWVRTLATQLQNSGVHVILDHWELVPGADVVRFMEQGVAAADRVIMICTASYVQKADSGVGGVGYERLIVSREIYERIDTTKFIPIVYDNPKPNKTPSFIGARLYVDFTDPARFDEKLDELLRAIHNAPAHPRPPLGINPFSGLLPDESIRAAVEADPFRSTDDWFAQQAEVANAGLAEHGRTGALELRYKLTGTDNWSQLALYNSVRQAEITTFGWPIGIVLENREEYKPQPRNDGVYAEVAITNKGFSESTSYDYWALRNDGSFFLLQSLFEDERTEHPTIFFNTRIVRVAEAILFGGRLYSGLGLADDRIVQVRIKHQGLKDRILSSSTPNRASFMAQPASDNVVEHQLHLRVDQMLTNVIDPVMQVCEPLFMIFGFQEFQRQVYDDIVTKFEHGEVT